MNSKQLSSSLAAICALALGGCVTTEPARQLTTSTARKPVPTEQALVISICRPKSVMRFAETPDFEVNGAVTGELSNGSKHEFVLNQGDKFRVNLPKNYLMQRYSDALIFDAVAEKKGHIYMKLATDSKPDWSAASDSLIFGAITASALQMMKDKNQNWHIHPLTSDNYESECAK